MADDPSSTIPTTDKREASWENDPLNHVVKAFAAFLQTIWEKAPRGCYHWAKEGEDTEIVITEANPVQLSEVDKLPAISLMLGRTRFNGSSLDDLVNVKIGNAEEVHTDLLPGTMTLNCLSSVPQEARFIAWQSARTIWNLRKIFIKETHIHEVGRHIEIGAVTPAGQLVQGDNMGEWHNVSVTCPFFLQWTDSVTPLKTDWNDRPINRLNNIGMQFRTRLAKAQPNLTHTQDYLLQPGNPTWGEKAAAARANQIIRRQAVLKPPTMRGKVIKVQTSVGFSENPIEQKAKA